MADAKISALLASTTPLAGTEVLPIVQSTTTKKVSVADLTAGRAVGVGSLTSTGTVSAAGVIDSTGTVDRIPFYNSGKQLVTNAGLTFTASDGSGTAAVLVAAINNTGAAGNLALRSTKDNANRSILDLKATGVDIYSPGASTATKAIEIDTTQNVKVSVGNLVIGTSGKGIDFSATAGTGTSELFDDYEEGEWTPVFSDAASGGNVSPSQAALVGRYTKIGNLVVCRFRVLNINTTGMTAGNDFFIQGFPFLSEGTTYNDTVGVVATERITFTGAVALELPRNETYARLVEYASNADDDYIIVSEVASNLGDIIATISYTVA